MPYEYAGSFNDVGDIYEGCFSEKCSDEEGFLYLISWRK